MSTIKDLRIKNKYTQQQVADLVGISIRSYKSYENDPNKENTIKYKYILQKLEAINYIDENHGILDMETIANKCKEVLSEYPVNYCVLFGSYAKNKAKEDSDIDLLISSEVKGLKFYEMTEKLRNNLNKKVDVLSLKQLNNNMLLIDEILKDGIKIYG